MDWFCLIFAGFLEMFGVAMINQWHRTKKLSVILVLAVAFTMSFFFLSIAMKSIPMGTAYAVWTGIGATGGAILGMAIYGESKERLRIFFILLILSATIGLKVLT
ncbi:DMT family transporter [Bacillus solitudinis]|uniref:DMT family transporter n=1 Tax=Bacillus solitudinis TaxID=2014074 RepID=UPI000C246A0D|nr:multidrug efflux SMR transporter [Bacillus solitudinis]